MDLNIHGRRYIKDDKEAIWIRIAAYVGSFILLIFGLNALNFYIIGLSMLPLGFLFASEAVGLKTGKDSEPPNVPKSQLYEARMSAQKQQSVLLGVAVSVFLFAAYWYVAPDLFGLPASVFSSLAISSGLLTAFGVDMVYSFSEAVAEERFVRFAVVNGTIYLTGNAWFGVVGSTLVFWAIHVSRYWADPQAQGLILVSGSFLGYIDILYQSILVSTLAHVIWNVTVGFGTAAVAAVPGLASLAVGSLAFVAAPMIVFAPVAILMWRRHGSPFAPLVPGGPR